MKCSICNGPAKAMGSALNGNGELLFTNYICFACNKRWVKSRANPRFVPQVKIIEDPVKKPYTYRKPRINHVMP